MATLVARAAELLADRTAEAFGSTSADERSAAALGAAARNPATPHQPPRTTPHLPPWRPGRDEVGLDLAEALSEAPGLNQKRKGTQNCLQVGSVYDLAVDHESGKVPRRINLGIETPDFLTHLPQLEGTATLISWRGEGVNGPRPWNVLACRSLRAC